MADAATEERTVEDQLRWLLRLSMDDAERKGETLEGLTDLQTRAHRQLDLADIPRQPEGEDRLYLLPERVALLAYYYSEVSAAAHAAMVELERVHARIDRLAGQTAPRIIDGHAATPALRLEVLNRLLEGRRQEKGEGRDGD